MKPDELGSTAGIDHLKEASGSAAAEPFPDSSTPGKWAWHLRTLVELRSRLLGERDSQMAVACEPVDSTLDPADSASDEFDHELALAMLENKDQLREEIEAAIQRIHSGTYGICEETRSVIPPERLLAVPWARYCREVEARLEAAGQRLVPRVQPSNSATLHGEQT